MAWRLEGSFVENCNCDSVCPCLTSVFNRPGDEERCQVLFHFQVRSGDIDGVDVSGLGIALAIDAPAMMTEGGWRVGLVLDEAASEDQAQALAAVFSGEKGRPMASFAPLIGELLGMERAPVSLESHNGRRSARVGDVEVEVSGIVAESSAAGEAVQVSGVLHPAGSTFTVAPSERATGSLFGIPFANTGKHAAYTEFAWAGD